MHPLKMNTVRQLIRSAMTPDADDPEKVAEHGARQQATDRNLPALSGYDLRNECERDREKPAGADARDDARQR